MDKEIENGEYPKGELKRISHALTDAGVPEVRHPLALRNGSIADRVAWLIRENKRLSQSREGLKTRIGKMDAIIRKQWHELYPNGKCICADCDIYGCRPDCDPCFDVLPETMKNLLRDERNRLKKVVDSKHIAV